MHPVLNRHKLVPGENESNTYVITQIYLFRKKIKLAKNKLYLEMFGRRSGL